ncbi:DUF6011 domain-containing protein [Streptomyces cadmiisoli]|nr:DUF6011 domain-containing protein [Streptomyces cadmiisoli]
MFGFPPGGSFAAKIIKRLESYPARAGYTVSAPVIPVAVPAPKAPEARTYTATAPAIQARGMYRLNGEIYKVVDNPRTGRFAAHKLDMETRKYTYAKGIIYKLTEAHRLDTSTIAAHGLDQLWCLCCGRALDRKDSQERGIGPICADKYGF